MKRLLLVDDDATVLQSYRNRLSAHGFQVNTAASGSAALTILRAGRPDLVVLDLMMPDLSGVDVLKFIRADQRLAATPVVVLTNAYLNDLGRQAATIGIERALLKAQCSPSVLMAVIDEILEGRHAANQESPAAGAPMTSPGQPEAQPGPTLRPARRDVPAAPQPDHAKAEPARHARPGDAGAEPRPDLLAHHPAFCAELRDLFQAFARESRDGPEQQLRLKNLYRKVHFLATAAGLKEHGQLAQTATVFEALLYVLMREPGRVAPSVLRTLAGLVDFVELLLRRAGEGRPSAPLSPQILVVDDDPLSNRVIVSALRQAGLNTRSTEDPQAAWQWLSGEHFDLVLLDIEMPGLDGIELCERLRRLPGYEKTPVIFVTIHTDFESRAKSTLSGGNDLIAKPILPMELAAKVVMHLIKSQIST